jgi:hypothetical protein
VDPIFDTIEDFLTNTGKEAAPEGFTGPYYHFIELEKEYTIGNDSITLTSLDTSSLNCTQGVLIRTTDLNSNEKK